MTLGGSRHDGAWGALGPPSDPTWWRATGVAAWPPEARDVVVADAWQVGERLGRVVEDGQRPPQQQRLADARDRGACRADDDGVSELEGLVGHVVGVRMGGLERSPQRGRIDAMPARDADRPADLDEQTSRRRRVEVR